MTTTSGRAESASTTYPCDQQVQSDKLFISLHGVRLVWIIVTPETYLFFMYIMIKQSENYFISVISSFLHAYIDEIFYTIQQSHSSGEKNYSYTVIQYEKVSSGYA